MENQTSSKHSYPIPDNYKFIKVLGDGGYGTVIKCLRHDTNEEVAVKIDKDPDNFCLEEEAFIMKILMDHDLDDFNIIKYNGALLVNGVVSLEYECLDTNLDNYLINLEEGMPLEDIRSVIQQMAVAFEALECVNLIHTDVKPDNILLVDRVKRPLRVKLIDFGLAISSEDTMIGMSLQIPEFRAPEITLGLPFTESIDIWALGVVMATMVFHTFLFPGNDEYQTVLYIIDLLGPPPQHLLKAGRKTEQYFKETSGGLWILKTPVEYYGYHKYLEDERTYTFRFLDETKNNKGAEWRECINLLKVMLQWDERDRITASDILNHPFITKSYLENGSSYMVPSRMKDNNNIKEMEDEENKMKVEVMKKDEEIKRMREKIKRKNKEIKRMAEEISMKNKEIRKNEEIKGMHEELKKTNEIKDEENKKTNEIKDEEIKRIHKEIKRLEAEIKRKDEEIKMKDEKMMKEKKKNCFLRFCYWILKEHN